jgi:2-hydroxychromene-2-carboxylate isomerase
MRVEVIRQLTEYHDCTVGLEPAATGIIVLIRGPAIPQRQAKLKS